MCAHIHVCMRHKLMVVYIMSKCIYIYIVQHDCEPVILCALPVSVLTCESRHASKYTHVHMTTLLLGTCSHASNCLCQKIHNSWNIVGIPTITLGHHGLVLRYALSSIHQGMLGTGQS